ncbi:MAG: hypothetical protein PVG33_17255, partial [Chloroflexota bacterium]
MNVMVQDPMAALTVLQAKHRIQRFRKRFADYGDAHLFLAYHAAFPLVLTADLVYRMWVNFDRDEQDTLLDIPWIATADLLLSDLCHEAGYELYEIDADVRQELLRQFRADLRFGEPRLKELADFLEEYSYHLRQDQEDPSAKALADVHLWTALSHKNPDRAVREMLAALNRGLDAGNRGEILRMANLTDKLATRPDKYKPLRVYLSGVQQYAQGNGELAAQKMEEVKFDHFQKLGIELVRPKIWEEVPETKEAPPAEPEGERPLEEALKEALAIGDPADRARALTALIPDLPQERLTQVAAEALNTIEAIDLPRRRVSALVALAPWLPEQERARIVDQALGAARAIEDADERAAALAELAPYLPLEQQYDRTVADVATATDIPEATLRDWFEEKLITPEGTRNAVLMDQDQSEGLLNRAVVRLVEARLLRAAARQGQSWIELADDRFIEPILASNQAWRERQQAAAAEQPYRYDGPAVTFFTGLHGPADDAVWSRSDFRKMIERLNLPLVFMSDGENLKFADMGDPARNVVRLYWNPEQVSADEAYEYIRDVQLKRWWERGYRRFIFFNEPQITREMGQTDEGMGIAWHSADDFARFLRTCLSRARQEFESIQLYTTPVNSNDALDPWVWREAIWQHNQGLVSGWCMHAFSSDNGNAAAAVNEILGQVRAVQRRLRLQIPILVSEASINRGDDAEQKARVALLLAEKAAEVPGLEAVFWYAADWDPSFDVHNEGWFRAGIGEAYLRLRTEKRATETAAAAPVILDVPYRSSTAEGSPRPIGGGGPDALVMLLNSAGAQATAQEIVGLLDDEGSFVSIQTLIGFAADRYGFKTTYQRADGADEAMVELRGAIDDGRPFIALVRYDPIRALTGF